MKIYNVIWTECMSVNVEANSVDEAKNIVYDRKYDENGLASEIDSPLEVYVVPCDVPFINGTCKDCDAMVNNLK